MMQRVLKLKEGKLFFVVATLVLFLSFTINLFGVLTMFGFSSSEYIVMNQIVCKGEVHNNQLLGFDVGKDSQNVVCEPENLLPYYSQYGLQGKIYTIGYRVLDGLVDTPIKVYARLAQVLTALTSASLVALIAWWVRGRYGLFVASIFIVLAACSPMVISFARDLYWAFPLMLAPLLLTLYFFKSSESRSWHIKFYVLLGILLYLRYLCGYEYLTTITIMVIAVMSYHLFLDKADRKTVFKHVGTAFGVSVVAFFMAFGTHIFTLQQSVGSFSRAVEIIEQRALVRTVDSSSHAKYAVLGFKNNLSSTYYIANEYLNLESKIGKESELWATMAATLNYALMPVTILPFISKEPIATYVHSVAFFILLLTILYVYKKRWIVVQQDRDIKALYVASIVGFAGFMSWLVIARSHSLVHAHINGVLLYLPFALFAYIIIGLYLQSLKNSLLEKTRR